MKIKMSPNVAVRTERYQEALEFYANVFGFRNTSEDSDLGDFEATPLHRCTYL